MLNKFIKIWYKVSHAGVQEGMTIALEKKIVLSNQLAIIFLLVFSLMNFVLMIFEPVDYHILYSFISIFSLLIVPYMNNRGGYHTSAFLISVLTPFFTFYWGSMVYDHHPSIINYVSPRLFLTALIAIPFIVIDKSKKLSLFISLAFIFVLIIFLDSYLSWQGYAFSPENIDFESYKNIRFYATFAGFILLFSLIFLSNINVKYEDKILQLISQLKQSNDELEQQSYALQKAYNIIELKNKKITDSIEYAGKIQQAFLPSSNALQKAYPESFILYLPRDIVSGDYYWVHENEDYKIIIAADCTGHGVPGAFLSVLGITLLNDLVLAQKIVQPDILLNELRKQVKIALNQTSFETAQKDGMDISVAVIHIHTSKLMFSGAYNPLYIIRKNELIVLPATRQPVGIYRKEKDFELQVINLQKADMVYIFSDGYVSQFGRERSEKYGYKRFKNMFIQIADYNAKEQKKYLVNELTQWQYEYEQVDDILVIGFRIT